MQKWLRPTLLIIIIIFFFCLAWQFQQTLFLSWDISYMLRASARMLAHGTYSHDFFNPNTPISFYLYAVINILPQKISAMLTPFQLVNLYVYILIAFSLLLCYLENKNLTLILAALLLFLPLYEMGQREHFVIIFILPYILLLANRLEQIKSNKALSVTIGMIAGIGFAIKPHYLLIFVLLEIYFLFKSKKISALFRPESIMIAFIVCSHLLLIKYFYPDYFTTIIPYLLRLYLPATQLNWPDILFNNIAMVFYLTCLLYYVSHDTIKSKIIYTLFFIALVGFFIAYYQQGTSFYYHLLPILFFSLLIVYLSMKENAHVINGIIAFIILFTISQFYYELYHVSQNYTHQIQPLVTFMQKNTRQKSVSFYVDQVSVPLLAIDESSSILGQRFDCHWAAAGLANSGNQSSWRKDKDFYIAMVNEDLIKYKPSYVFVDKRANKQYFKKNFDYLSFFLTSPDFRIHWQQYRFVTTLQVLGVYQFDVYKRTKQ